MKCYSSDEPVLGLKAMYAKVIVSLFSSGLFSLYSAHFRVFYYFLTRFSRLALRLSLLALVAQFLSFQPSFTQKPFLHGI